ncbi:MAG: malic enzyme-like NAD(P)-binding protein, partial [Dokdonella sp.]
MEKLEELKQAALEYHRRAPAGKIKVTPTKSVVTQRELSLAYSPGVAAACEEIVRDPTEAANLTARGNLVAVITNGTAVLGLGNIGPLAAKPVMEGKGMLFQKFAGIACLDMLVSLGLTMENVWVADRLGVIYQGRVEEVDENKARYARETSARTLGEIIDGADIFLGLSAPGVLTQDMVRRMGSSPIILALANPTPEILPELAREARPDAIIATGRSDYPNQVNNALCFPYLFRGALDVGATTINEAM